MPDESPPPEIQLNEPGQHTAEKALPPVQPPTAGFVFQLFIIPAIIVGIIAVVSLLFSWLAHMGGTSESLVKDLERGGPHSWQTAYNLARELQKPGNAVLRRDEALAGKLATMLDRQLDIPLSSYEGAESASVLEPNPRKAMAQLRFFLCRTLGEFETSVVLPVLIRAATTEEYVGQGPNDLGDEYVRLSAIEAITVLVGRLGPARIPNPDVVNDAIHMACERDDDSMANGRTQLRSAAAFAMGVMGGESNLDRLASMCNDAELNVRFNAATGLARNGDVRCQEVLLEMLSVDLEAIPSEGDQGESYAQVWKQHTIWRNALRCLERLAHENPGADMDVFRMAVGELLQEESIGELISEVRETLDVLENRP